MRVVIAVKPGTGGEWIEDALCRLPLPDPLDIVLVSAVHIPRPPLTSPGRHARRLDRAALGALRKEAEQGAKRTTDLLQQQFARRAARVAVRILAARPAIAIVQAATVWGSGADSHGWPLPRCARAGAPGERPRRRRPHGRVSRVGCRTSRRTDAARARRDRWIPTRRGGPALPGRPAGSPLVGGPGVRHRGGVVTGVGCATPHALAADA